jgi:hypothetical protein
LKPEKYSFGQEEEFQFNTRQIYVDQKDSNVSKRTESKTYPYISTGGFTEESKNRINMEGNS